MRNFKLVLLILEIGRWHKSNPQYAMERNLVPLKRVNFKLTLENLIDMKD